MKGQQQVDQMTGSIGDTIKLIMIDCDRLEHLCGQGKLIGKLGTIVKSLV